MKISVGYGNITEYEPFTNGPSPNPDYKQEIKNAGKLNEETGRYEIGCCVGNKNFWDKEYASDVNNWVNIPSLPDILFLKISLMKGQTYYIDDLPVNEFHIRLTNSTNMNSAYYGWISNPYLGATSLVREFVAEEDYVYIGISKTEFENFQEQYSNYIQIEAGSTSTNYTPHASQPFTLTSDRPLTMWDKLVKRDGVWGWSIQAKEYVYDGTEFDLNSNDFSSGEYFRAYIYSAIALKGTECRCNMFRYHTSYEVAGTCGFWFNDAFCMRIPNSWLEPYGFVYTPESSNNSNANKAFKAMLADKGPIKIVVDMQEEQAFIPLPDEEQELLKNLETYYGVTNVYNEQGCPISITYAADGKLYVDQKLEQINSALLSLGANI